MGRQGGPGRRWWAAGWCRRLRLGVGRPPGRQEPSSYLLQDFRSDQMLVVTDLIELALKTVEVYLSEGIDIAMTQFNGVSADS